MYHFTVKDTSKNIKWWALNCVPESIFKCYNWGYFFSKELLLVTE